VVPPKVTVPAGSASATVMVMGVSQAAAVTLTATLGTDQKTSTVRVIGAGEIAKLTSITPGMAHAAPGKILTFTLGFHIPVEAARTVTLSATGGMLGTTMVNVPKDTLSATFTYT